MPDTETLALLREALDLLNDRPNFSLRRDRSATSYRLAARIDAHLAKLEASAISPLSIAIARWGRANADIIRVDPGETETLPAADGMWVRAWVLVGSAELPNDPDPQSTDPEDYRAAVLALPAATRDIFLAHLVEGCDYRTIVERFAVSGDVVEQAVAAALKHLARMFETQ